MRFFVRIRALLHATARNLPKIKGRRSAGRRGTAAPRLPMLPPANASGAARATNDPLARTVRLRARSPLGAPLRLLSPASERRTSAQAALHAMLYAGVTGALAARLSEAPRAPAIVPAGSMPGPPGSGLRVRPQDAALAPPSGSHPECAPRRARPALLVRRVARIQEIPAGRAMPLIR